MPAPRNIIRTIETHVSLPEDLVGEIDILLWSDLQGRVPKGARAKFFEAALRNHLAAVKAANQGA